MIRQVIKVEQYWKVIVYYDVDYNLFYLIADELKKLDFDNEFISRIYNNLFKSNAKAVTISNSDKLISIVILKRHLNKFDYINSIVHEAEHVKQAMLYAYKVKDQGEPPAYTIGYLVKCMLQFFDK